MANTKQVDWDGPLPSNMYIREKIHDACGRHWFYISNGQCAYCTVQWGRANRARKRKLNPPKRYEDRIMRYRGEKTEQRRLGAAQRAAIAAFSKPLSETS